MATNNININDKEYEAGPDIDLDVEEVRRSDGSRLTEKAAEQLGKEIARRGRGRPSLTGEGKHSPHVSFRIQPEIREATERYAEASGKSISQVAREALEVYVEQVIVEGSFSQGTRVEKSGSYELSGEEVIAVSKGDIHTIKHGDGWANRAEGNDRVSNTAPTKAEAQERGRDMAIDRGVEHLVHRQDGTIGERNTYPRSHDPKSSKG